MEWWVLLLVGSGALALIKLIDWTGDKVDHKTGWQVGTIVAVVLGGVVFAVVIGGAREAGQREQNRAKFEQNCTWAGTC
jgi:hypothetical protein